MFDSHCIGCGRPWPQHLDPVKHGEFTVCDACAGRDVETEDTGETKGASDGEA